MACGPSTICGWSPIVSGSVLNSGLQSPRFEGRERRLTKKPPPRQGCVFTPFPYLADRSAGFGTLRPKGRRLPGFTGPIPSTHLDKAALFSCWPTIYGLQSSLSREVEIDSPGRRVLDHVALKYRGRCSF